MRASVYMLMIATALSGETLLHEDRGIYVSRIMVRLDAGNFNLPELEHLAVSELKNYPQSHFTQLLIYGAKGGPPLPKPDHISFDDWHRLYNASTASGNELAELISIGRDATLRVHEAKGSVSSKVISGRDPLEIQIGKDRFEIVHFGFSTSVAYGREVDVYIQTTAPLSPESGLALLPMMEALFPNYRVSVAARHDAWFIFERGYPFLNPLVAQGALPTADEYERTQTLICSRFTNAASCRFE